LNELAAGAAPGCKGLLFLPYLATAATPHWNADARAAFIGLSLAHGKEELTRAVMEGVALEIRDMMQQWLQRNMEVKVLRIGGGATRSALWNQIQADVYGIPVQTVEETESTVLGAAILAGVGAGIFNSIEEGVENMVRIAGDIEPSRENHALYEDIYQAFVRAYEGLDQGGAFASLARIQQGSS
jgi:xylulokinase